MTKVGVRTFTDGLIRADQIIGLSTHPTPALSGKPAHWLVDTTLAVSVGSGGAEGLNISALHRTLLQTRTEPIGALEAFAQLLSRPRATAGRAGWSSTSRPSPTPSREPPAVITPVRDARRRDYPFRTVAAPTTAAISPVIDGHHPGLSRGYL